MTIFEGRVCLFDSINQYNNFIFSKDCEIELPGKVPVLYNFEKDDPGKVLGFATIQQDKLGLLCKCELKDSVDNIFTENEYYVGGYYTNVNYRLEDSHMIITSCCIKAMSIVPEGAHCSDELKVRRVK